MLRGTNLEAFSSLWASLGPLGSPFGNFGRPGGQKGPNMEIPVAKGLTLFLHFWAHVCKKKLCFVALFFSGTRFFIDLTCGEGANSSQSPSQRNCQLRDFCRTT